MKVKEKREMSNHIKSKAVNFLNLLFLEEVRLPKFWNASPGENVWQKVFYAVSAEC